MKGLLKSKQGIINVFVALSMVVIIGFAALAVDIGVLSYNKSRLQNACDAAALAGAKELPDKDSAEAKVKEYLIDNELGRNRTDLDIVYLETTTLVKFTDEEGIERELFSFETEFEGETEEEPTKIIVRAHEPVDYMFARIFGRDRQTVSVASAAAPGEPLKAIYDGLRPFGVQCPTGGFVLNEEIEMTVGPHDNDSGNFHSLALDGETGADELAENIEDGSETGYEVGDFVPTEPGFKKGPVFLAAKALEGSVILVPVLAEGTWEDTEGRELVKIIGFAEFRVIEVNQGKGTITGEFIQMVDDGVSDPNETNYGAVGVKLVPVD